MPNNQPQKNREMGGAKAFGGHRLIERHNNQPSIGVISGRFPIGGTAGVECVAWCRPIVWVDDETKK